jgi:hypothetical protein
MKKLVTAAVIATMAVAQPASAAVTFDAIDGTGFVGKGDVQLAFGWNNAALQRNAAGVTFTFQQKDFYDVTCEWETVTGGPRSKTIEHDVTIQKNTQVRSSIVYDARVRNQITGFNLNGFSITVTTGSVPEVGASCPMAHATAEVTEVVQTRSEGGLSVSHGGTSFLIG